MPAALRISPYSKAGFRSSNQNLPLSRSQSRSGLDEILAGPYDWAMAFSYDPSNAEFQIDPYPVLTRLRDEDPLHTNRNGFQVVTRYEDVVPLLRDRRCSSEFPSRRFAEAGRLGFTAQAFARAIVHREAPDHTNLRHLLAEPFSQRGVAGLRATIEELVNGLLDEAEGRDPDRIDLIGAVAVDLPYLVNYALLGVPVDDHRQFFAWIQDIERASMPMPTTEALATSNEAITCLRAYLDYVAFGINAEHNCLLAELITQAPTKGFSREVLVDNAIGLFAAGAETVTGLIGNTIHTLLEWPDELDRLRAEPLSIPAVVNEILRFESPINTSYRWTIGDIAVPSGTVKEGTFVYLSLASANRDPRAFANPEVFDPRRRKRDHVAFGSGRHLCLGARLARLQGEIVLERVLERYSEFRLGGPPERRRSVELRGFEVLPLAVSRRS